MTVAAVKFHPWDHKSYDYLVPEGVVVQHGDKVFVNTSRGLTEVEVVEVKEASERATKEIILRKEPEPTYASGLHPTKDGEA